MRVTARLYKTGLNPLKIRVSAVQHSHKPAERFQAWAITLSENPTSVPFIYKITTPFKIKFKL
jgi:hypothetical protein